jgi:hypothetical protein
MSALECKSCAAKSQEPVALAVFKRGRWCIIAKLTFFSGDAEPILAIGIRGQRGTSEMFSLPLSAINFAVRCGVRWVYHRYDRFPFQMRRVLLQTFKQNGYLQKDGEIYFPLAGMEVVPWQQWQYATRVIELPTEEDESVAKQLSMFVEYRDDRIPREAPVSA